MHVIAAKAVAFGEALRDDFRSYSARVIDSAQALGRVLRDGGPRLVTDDADCHLLLVDLTPFGLDGRAAAEALERVGLTVNKNAIPFDPRPPALPASGSARRPERRAASERPSSRRWAN